MATWVQCRQGKCRKVYDLDQAMAARSRWSDYVRTPCCDVPVYVYDVRRAYRELTPAEVEAVENGWGHVDDKLRTTRFEVVK